MEFLEVFTKNTTLKLPNPELPIAGLKQLLLFFIKTHKSLSIATLNVTRNKLKANITQKSTQNSRLFLAAISRQFWIFSVCAPQYVMRPPVTEHVPLHSKSLCKNIARASGGGGGANNMHPLSWGGGAQTEKIHNFIL